VVAQPEIVYLTKGAEIYLHLQNSQKACFVGQTGGCKSLQKDVTYLLKFEYGLTSLQCYCRGCWLKTS